MPCKYHAISLRMTYSSVSFMRATVDIMFAAINHAMSTVCKWMRDNFLFLNPSKTHCQLFSPERAQPPSLSNLIVGDMNINVQLEGSRRCLGVQLDWHLNMEAFISNTCRKAFLMLRVLGNRSVRVLPSSYAILLCWAMLISAAPCSPRFHNHNSTDCSAS